MLDVREGWRSEEGRADLREGRMSLEMQISEKKNKIEI